MTPVPLWLLEFWIINRNLAAGAILACFWGWVFDSLTTGLILFALWCIVMFGPTWDTVRSVRAGREALNKSRDSTDIRS